MPDLGVGFRVDGADQITRALREMETDARRFGATVQTTFQPAQQAVRAFSSALGSLSTIVRLTGSANADLARQIETASVAVLSITLAVQGLRGATAGYTAALVVLRTTMATVTATATAMWAALLGPFGVVLAAAAAVGVALGLIGEKTGFAAQATRDFADSIGTVSRATEFLAGSLTSLTAATDRYRNALSTAGQSLVQFGVQQDLAAARDAKAKADAAKSAAEAAARIANLRLERESDAAVAYIVALRNWEINESLKRQKVFLDQAAEAEQRLAEERARTARAFERIQRAHEALFSAAAAGDIELINELFGVFAQIVGVDAVRAALAAAAAVRGLRDATFDAAQAQERLNTAVEQTRTAQEGAAAAARSNIQVLLQEVAQRRQLRDIEVSMVADPAKRAHAATAAIREEIAGISAAIAKLSELRAIERQRVEELAEGTDVAAYQRAKQAVAELEAQIAALQHRGRVAGLELELNLGAPMRQLATDLSDAFQRSFEDMLQNARTVGDAIVGFFRGVVNALISMFARFVAQRFFDFLLPLFGGPALSAPGFNIPVRAPIVTAQHGMIVDRPTMTFLGEGGEREMILPERFWPALRGGPARGGRPQEIVVKVITVLDPRQIPASDPSETVMIIDANIKSGGVLEKTIRRMVR